MSRDSTGGIEETPRLALWLAGAMAVDQLCGLSSMADVWEWGAPFGRSRAAGIWVDHGPELLVVIIVASTAWARLGRPGPNRYLGWVCLGMAAVSLLMVPWVYFNALRMLETMPITGLGKFEASVFRGMGLLGLLSAVEVSAWYLFLRPSEPDVLRSANRGLAR